MLKETLTILALSDSEWMSSKEVRTKLDLIKKKTRNDRLPFRETQTRFDKKFYNFISRRDSTFKLNGKTLIKSTQSGNVTLMRITEHGLKFILNQW